MQKCNDTDKRAKNRIGSLVLLYKFSLLKKSTIYINIERGIGDGGGGGGNLWSLAADP